MESTRRLDIELPEDMAEAVEARVATGQYANPSEVVRQGLRLLAEEENQFDPALDQWLKTEVVAAYDAVKEGREEFYTAEEVRDFLAQARARQDAAE